MRMGCGDGVRFFFADPLDITISGLGAFAPYTALLV